MTSKRASKDVASIVCVEIHGDKDKEGKTPFALYWAASPRTDGCPPESGVRAQEFRADLREYRARLRSQGKTLRLVKDSTEARRLLGAEEVSRET